MSSRPVTRVLLPACLLLGAALSSGPAHAAPDHRFNEPYGVAVDRFGNVFVADSGDSRLIKLSPRGVELQSWVERGTDFVAGSPSALAVDGADSVYVTDDQYNTVLKYNAHGRLVAQWAHNGDGELNSPEGIALGGRGTIFVANTDNENIEKLSPHGYVLAVWPLDRTIGASLATANGIAVGADGTIYTTIESSKCATCTSTSSIQTVVPDGARQVIWSTTDFLPGIAVGGRGNIFVVDQGASEIIKLSPDGQQLAEWTAGSIGGFSWPSAVAIDAQGNVYIADSGNNRIVKLSSFGQVLAVWQ